MKSCPKCKRTYADDGFTFCLEDGALLSPPYDAAKSDEPVSTIKSTGPPPTAVFPATESGERELPPTVMRTAPRKAEDAKPQTRAQTESPSRTSPLKYVVTGLVTLVIAVTGLGFLGLYLAGGSNCPRLVVNCSPSDTTTYCSLSEDKSAPLTSIYGRPISEALCSRSVLGLQAAAPPSGIANVSWSASSGTIRATHSQFDATIDTSGQAGKTIEVKAKVTSSSWFCSTTVSTSFVVPAGFGPPQK